VPVILAVPATFRPCSPVVAVVVPVNVNLSIDNLTVVSLGNPAEPALATVKVIACVNPVAPVPLVTEDITRVPVRGEPTLLLELKGVIVVRVMVEVWPHATFPEGASVTVAPFFCAFGHSYVYHRSRGTKILITGEDLWSSY